MYYVQRDSQPLDYYWGNAPVHDVVSFEDIEDLREYLAEGGSYYSIWRDGDEDGHTVYLDENLEEYYHFDFQGIDQLVYLSEADSYDEALELANQRLNDDIAQQDLEESERQDYYDEDAFDDVPF